MTDRDNISIHQTLHGYKEGHNLLASSSELNGMERRTLSVMSDYTGTGVEKGFTEYITGYPLAGSKFYAFSKTWYADEMPRPGCVWTHTLLIDLSVLWMINNLSLLSSLFRRPSESMYNSYNNSIQLNLAQVSENNPDDSVFFPFVSCQLYNGDRPLIIYSDSAKQLESAILQTWLFQWPRLRRHFSFCTGSISPRRLESKFLDLQVMPNSRKWTISKTDRLSLQHVEMEDGKCTSDWYQRYLNENKDEVLDYMRKMGADVSPLIPNFKHLFNSYLFSKQFPTASNIIDFQNILSQFESPEEGKILKADLLQKIWPSPVNKFDIIKTIANSSGFSGLKVNYDVLVLDGYSKNAFNENEIKITLEIVRSKIDKSIYADLLANLPFDRWLPHLSLYQDVIEQLISRLGTNVYKIKTIWMSDNETKDFWFNYFLEDHRTEWNILIFSLIETHTTRFCTQLYEKLGNSIYHILFDWMMEHDEALSHEWLYFIKGNLASSFEAFVNYEHYNTTLLQLFPAILSPTDSQWSKISFQLIERCLNSISTKQYLLEKTALQTFFLTGAFMGTLNDKLRATVFLFQPLHDTLEQNIFDPVTWQRFQAQMAKELYELVEVDFFSIWFPDRFKIPDWDRCEFLRRSLICAFLKFDWNLIEYVTIVTDKRTFEYIVRFCSEVKPLKKQMKILENHLLKKGSNKNFHLRVLDKFL
ncbi:GAP1-N1 domain-containing protein [Chitinophaga rhizophila]|uniref:Uncharacterized protein n=1 Tax=Chitinophaga rhizophila TaxID=2866212 RepID=A0ABS7G780_9BACT|nr:hypothetical protein [Chitinophaga rhizophila]MBW8683517.1 hypothetical protein [Chitinophaga rhizophila]